MPKRTLPQPRSWVSHEAQRKFGRADIPDDEWKRPARSDPVGRGLLAAARSQHEFMRVIGSALKSSQSVTPDDLVQDLGVTVDQLRRLRRGESQLLLADMHTLAARLRISMYTGAFKPGDT